VSDGAQNDIWIYDWKRDKTSKLTTGPSSDTNPVWTPSGNGIVFASDRANRGIANLYWQRADGTGEAQQLTKSPHTQVPYSFHPNGQVLAFQETGNDGTADLMLLPLEGNDAKGWTPGIATAFLATPASEAIPIFSPDGRWIAYQSSESERMEIYVRPYPGPGGKWQVSDGTGGLQAAWSRTAPQLLFLQPRAAKVMVADYTVRDGILRSEKPRVWSPTSYFTVGGLARTYDIHPDGRRLAISTPAESRINRRTAVTMIFNFFEELRRVAPAARAR
jgi:Tol biopolymer transport system component